ncbi:MAG: 23S rRNA (pseudouridine(1915)-N(3))-methyltransferase RlmH [Burkholderiaceae bacterium]
MLIRIIAVGARSPRWVDEAVSDYLKRIPPPLRIELVTVRTEERTAAGMTATLLSREAERIRAQFPGERGHGPRGQSQRGPLHRVVLDQRGTDITTAALAERLASWQEQARPVAMLIGGPDGFDPALAAEADETLRLSSLTLPHTLARVVVVEQLYRAWSVLANHPYHRA